MEKLFLLDAYALIYRSYYAFIKNPRINSKGLNTSAIMGFLNTLQEVLTKEQPTHLGVAFDPHGPTFRSEAYPAYFGNVNRVYSYQEDHIGFDANLPKNALSDIIGSYHQIVGCLHRVGFFPPVA